MRTTIHDLPAELLDFIFEELVLLEVTADRKIGYVVLVCWRWRGPALGALFRNVTIGANDTSSAWLASPAKHLKAKTRRLTLFGVITAVLDACGDNLVRLATSDSSCFSMGNPVLQHPAFQSKLEGMNNALGY